MQARCRWKMQPLSHKTTCWSKIISASWGIDCIIFQFSGNAWVASDSISVDVFWSCFFCLTLLDQTAHDRSNLATPIGASISDLKERKDGVGGIEADSNLSVHMDNYDNSIMNPWRKKQNIEYDKWIIYITKYHKLIFICIFYIYTYCKMNQWTDILNCLSWAVFWIPLYMFSVGLA